jgi:hypothetical protein
LIIFFDFFVFYFVKREKIVSWGITQKCDFVFYFSISIALYNAYRAKILRSKFCKDKQNWSFETGLLKIWLT